MKTPNNIFLWLFISILLYSCTDSPVEPDTQFVQIYFKYGFNNELNTFESTYQKDLILDGTIKIKFWLTTEEQNRILSKANQIGFFSFPANFSDDTTFIMIDPNPGNQILRIKNDAKDIQTIWTCLIDLNNQQAVELLELNSLIISIIETKSGYKKLPPSRGGYM